MRDTPLPPSETNHRRSAWRPPPGSTSSASTPPVRCGAASPIPKASATGMPTNTFNLQWSLYHRADKAVKTGHAGFAWDGSAFARKMAQARERLALISRPPRTLAPGKYRAYLTPSAMEEIAGMLCWGGFSGRALATQQSALARMQAGRNTRSSRVADRGHGQRRRPRVSGRRLCATRRRESGRSAANSSARWSVRAPRANSVSPKMAPMATKFPSRWRWREGRWPKRTRSTR